MVPVWEMFGQRTIKNVGCMDSFGRFGALSWFSPSPYSNYEYSRRPDTGN